MRGITFYYTDIIKNKHVSIFDTTLRDGEQTPGVALTLDHKIEIATQLDKIGVDIIEAGFPRSSRGDMQSVKAICDLGLDLEVCGLSRVITADIDACLDCDVDMVHAFVPTSDIQRIHTIGKSREEVLAITEAAVSHIKDHGVKCMFSAMDATRTDFDFLIEVFKTAQNAGCDIINVPDTVGVMVPTTMSKLISDIAKHISIPIDVHCHNDFGLAVANSITAVEAGASQVQVTVNALGERAGNADIAETVMSLQAIYGATTNIKTEYFLETAKLVERYSGIAISPTMPIVGENAFAHESGIHTHGVLKKSDTFEPGIMTPEMVGQVRRIVVGKHAGKHAILDALNNAGMEPTDEQLNEIVKRIKDIADKGKRVTDTDMFAIADSCMGRMAKKERAIDLKEVTVITGNVITPTAVVKAIVYGETRTVATTGVGPVDAALAAVGELIGDKIRLIDFKIAAISGGADALAEVVISVEDKNKRIITASSAREDIVMASVEALVNAVNRLNSID